MTTALYTLVSSIDQRIEELEVLLSQAKECASKNELLFNALCRAVCVLIASQMESFAKDLTSAALDDLNENLSGFADFPSVIKRSFCEKIVFFEGVASREIDDRIRQLIDYFSVNSVKVDPRAFTYKENNNRNVSAQFLNRSLERLGLPRVIEGLSTPSFEVIFSGDAKASYVLLRRLRGARSKLYHFPYKRLPTELELGAVKKAVSKQTLWQQFLDEVLDRRHRVVHGDILTNPASLNDLVSDVLKLRVLMNGLALGVSQYLRAAVS